MGWFVRALVVGCVCVVRMLGQEGIQPTPQPAPQALVAPQPQDPDAAASLVTLRAVLDSIETKQRDAARVQADADAAARAGDEARKLALLAEVARVRAEIESLQQTLESIATGIDPQTQRAAPDSFDVVDEIASLLQPLIEELKDITAEPRLISQLRSELQRETLRHESARRGVERVRRLRDATTDPALLAALATVEDRWQRRAVDARNAQAVLQHRLDDKLRERRSVYESTRSFFGGFFRERGLNLLLAALAFAAVLIGLRFAYRLLFARRFAPRQRRFAYRLVSVSLQLASLVAAVLAALLVLYAAGDWILLGIVLLFLVGVAFASKHALPRFVEQIRLMLDLGPIRETERIVFEGLPWRVDRIHLHVRLVNPALTGGVLRLPVARLLGAWSRPCAEQELWFPSKEGDWVAVGGVRGKVVQQTPELVQLVTLGGARVTWRTAEYLARNPTNLSGGFRIATTFGIDHRHRAIATTTVPEVLQRALEGALRALVGDDHVVAVRVEFQDATAPSLDYFAFADLRGDAAPQHDVAIRAMQRAMLDACNQQGWGMPLPRLTVHQATG